MSIQDQINELQAQVAALQAQVSKPQQLPQPQFSPSIYSLLGTFETVSVVPTVAVPQSVYDQIKVYKNGSTTGIYVYDVANKTWDFIPTTGSIPTNYTQLLATNPNGVSGGVIGAETDVISFTLNGGLLGISRAVNIKFPFQAIPHSGTATLIFRLYYGGSTVLTLTLNADNANNLTQYGLFDCSLMASGATNTQYISMGAVTQVNSQTPLNLTGAISGGGTSAVDSTSNQTVTLSIQCSSAQSWVANGPVALLL